MSLVGNSGAARRIPLSREHRAPQWESPPSSRSCPCTEAAALSLPGASMSPLLRLLGLRSPGPSFPPPGSGGVWAGDGQARCREQKETHLDKMEAWAGSPAPPNTSFS